MNKIKLEFENATGETLAGLLEIPEGGHGVRAYALFAHCFTCGKDIAAASRISRALAARGIAVLRFDFTGLGNSDGDFANTNFSSNVDDLLNVILDWDTGGSAHNGDVDDNGTVDVDDLTTVILAWGVCM